MLTCGYLIDIIYLLDGGQVVETIEMMELYFKCIMAA